MAGSDEGNVQVRVLATVVDPDTDATVTAGGLAIAGAKPMSAPRSLRR